MSNEKDNRREYMLKYWAANPKKAKANSARYRAENPEKLKALGKKYRSTVRGWLVRRYHAMGQRCQKQKSYIDKGIKNNFESSDALVDYVVNELKVDPRGLECHRIDDDGHYEPGNIEFLTDAEHKNVHKKE